MNKRRMLMRKSLPTLVLLASVMVLFVARGQSQTLTTPAPDKMPAAEFNLGCVTSHFFHFTFQIPEGMGFEDLSAEPNKGIDPTHRNFIIFKAFKRRGSNQDVISVAAEDRNSAADSSAASWMRALHNWNATRADVVSQDAVESVPHPVQDLARLHFRQSRADEVLTYESAWAFGVKGYVEYFILGSVDRDTLQALDDAMGSLDLTNRGCEGLTARPQPSHVSAN
jgi:hypothetical protein